MCVVVSICFSSHFSTYLHFPMETCMSPLRACERLKNMQTHTHVRASLRSHRFAHTLFPGSVGPWVHAQLVSFATRGESACMDAQMLMPIVNGDGYAYPLTLFQLSSINPFAFIIEPRSPLRIVYVCRVFGGKSYAVSLPVTWWCVVPQRRLPVSGPVCPLNFCRRGHSFLLS